MYIHEVSFRNIVLKLYEILTIYVPKLDLIGYKAYKTIMVIFIWHMKIILFALSLVIYIQFLQSNDMILKIKLHMKCELLGLIKILINNSPLVLGI